MDYRPAHQHSEYVVVHVCFKKGYYMSAPIKEYHLVVVNDPHELSQIVSDMVREGWELYGNPFVGADNGQPWYHYQALVRSELVEAQPQADNSASHAIELAMQWREAHSKAFKVYEVMGDFIDWLSTQRQA
jgi:hypothetical protein